MANEIKKIEVGTLTYDLCDEYARQRIEGLATIYSISCKYTYKSGDTFVDYDSEEDITYSTMAIQNGKFLSLDKDVVISADDVPTGKSAYVVLLITKSANKYYAKKLTNLTLGDTIYVKEDATEAADRWLSSWTESPLSGTFTALDAKIDLSAYALKTVAGKAGTYTSTAASTEVSGQGGAQTAVGTATVSYKKADSATGSAGGASVTSGSAGGTATVNTGNAGAHTINGASFSFTGTTATISVEAEAVTLNDHSYTPVGTISAVSAASHSHTVNVAKATISNNVTGTATGSAGGHSHSVTAAGTIGVGTGTANYTPSGSINVVVDGHSFTTSGSVSVDSTAASKTPVVNSVSAELADDPEFTGTAKTISLSSSYQPAGTISQISHASHTHTVSVNTATVQPVIGVDANTGNAGAHNHTVTLATASYSAVNGLPNFNGGTFTQGSKASLGYTATAGYGFASAVTNVMSGATVDGGVLKWTSTNASTGLSKVNSWSANGNDSFTPASLGTLSYATISSYVNGVTLADAANHSHSIGSSKSTATITYVTGIKSVSNAGGYSVTPTFTGTTATISVSGSYTPEGTVSKPAINVTAGTINVNTDAIKAVSATFTGGQVILSHNVSTKSFTGTGAQLVFNGSAVNTNSVDGHTHSLTNSSFTYVTGATTSKAGGFDITPTFTGTAATIAHSFTDATLPAEMSCSYQPAGTIGGSVSVGSHSHSYVELKAHTHSVSVSAHTHSIGHTHQVTIPNCNS